MEFILYNIPANTNHGYQTSNQIIDIRHDTTTYIDSDTKHETV